MKNFNKKIYALNQKSTLAMPSTIPRMYFKMASKIANSFSKEYAAIGVMNINDLNQEAWLALLVTWKNINWEYINSLKTPLDKNKAISKYYQDDSKQIL